MGNCVKYTTGTFFYTLMLVVPILSVAHWVLEFETVWSDQDNHLKPWLFIYSASGIFQVMNFLLVVRRLMLPLLEEYNEVELEVQDEKIEKI